MDEQMKMPVECTKCGTVYDLMGVKVVARYADCSVWKCPGCRCTVDDRPPGWGDHHYREVTPQAAARRQLEAQGMRYFPH